MKKQAKGPRPKHVPQRTCIACRKTDAKRGLMRLVRTADGRIAIDSTGKQAGRGAYLCHEPACWEQALKRNGLVRALRLEHTHADDLAMLQQTAQTLQDQAQEQSTNRHDPER